MLMRFDPFRELDRLTEQLTGTAPAARSFPLDAYRRGDSFLVHFDLPGVDPESIDVSVEGNVLTVRAERRLPRQEGDEFVVAERPQGVFSRQLFLGETLDADRLDASYDQGVLTLTIPIAERAKPRRIQISQASRGAQPVEPVVGQGAQASVPGEGT
jgi:HSP20 family protein